GSNLTEFKGAGALRTGDSGPQGGRHINYGVREFGMAAIMNGLALHGGFVPYGCTFLTFSDYSRNAIRMAALMRQRVIHVLTHDSIGLGEDGPTHQPVAHAASLRLIPGLDVWRPADAVETALAWGCAIERADGPSALLLTRQAVPHVSRSDAQVASIRRGGYVLREAGAAQAILLATGSELALALGARDRLAERGIEVRVVSMPSTSVFDRQDVTYRSYVLSENLPRIAVEAGTRGAGPARRWRHRGPGGLHALDQRLRSAGCNIQVLRAVRESAPDRGRGRRHRRMVEVRLRRRDRYRHLWRIGAGAGAVR